MRDGVRRAEWQRRYDESIARERAAQGEADEPTDPVEILSQAGWSAPGLLGIVALVIAGIATAVRRLRPGRS